MTTKLFTSKHDKYMIFHSCVKGRYWLLTNQFALIMKLTVFLPFVAVLQATARSMAQTITLRSRNLPLSEVMEEVKKQSGFHFFLKGENLAPPRVNTSIRQAPLENAMELLTRNLGV